MAALLGSTPRADRRSESDAVGGGVGAAAHAPLTVVLVDDDHLYSRALAAELAERNIKLHHFDSASGFLTALDHVVAGADAVLLDWQLQKSSGLGLLVALRRRGIRLPVIFVTSFAEVDHEMQAFDTGAADFINKCRGVETLVRRLQLAVAVDPARGQQSSTCGDERLTLCRRLSRVSWQGSEIQLTRGEFNMLELLVVNAGHYVPYDSLHEVHHGARVASGVNAGVRSGVKRIRNKFRAVDPAFAAIDSYLGFGYRWRT